MEAGGQRRPGRPARPRTAPPPDPSVPNGPGPDALPPVTPPVSGAGTGSAAGAGSGAEPWPFRVPPRGFPGPGGLTGEDKHDRRIAGHAQRHKDRGIRPPRRDRGLSREEIVRTAIAVADAEGPDAISMRRIARELGAGAMSLYWYVGSKEELLELMLESLETEIVVPEPSGDWRGDLRTFAARTRAGISRHPWTLDFIGSRPPTGPNDARNLERLLAILASLGLPARVTMDVLGAITTYVLGAVIRDAREIRGQREQELAEANVTEEEREATRERYRDWFAASGQYPRIAHLMESGIDPDDPETRDERFEFGLNVLLEGIAGLAHASPPLPPLPPLDPPGPAGPADR
jgi:AcrR family transcriptional regulator